MRTQLSFFIGLQLMLLSMLSYAQQAVLIDDERPHHVISFGELQYLEDQADTLKLSAVLKPQINALFKPNQTYTPKTFNTQSSYWYKFKIRHNSTSKRKWVLEFFDQSIHHLQLYAPDTHKRYHLHEFGTRYTFKKRTYQHKNFVFDLANQSDGELTYYLKVKSYQSASAIVALREVHFFFGYALTEYLVFGLFYGMVTVFALYNLLMFVAVRQMQYLYYVLYNLSIALYEMSNDGIAYQYLWPGAIWFNENGFGLALFLSSFFGLLFTLSFLQVKVKAPRLYKLLVAIVILRILFFIWCLFDQDLFSFKLIEAIPLLSAFFTGIYIWLGHYQPAKYFVIGYSFLVIGFLTKILLLLGVSWVPNSPVTYYSMSIGFLMEMIFVSLAIGESIRTLRQNKEEAQQRIIEELQINKQLTTTLNEELNALVDERTQELKDKAFIIAQQNQEISLMNVMLEKDNEELHQNIKKVSKARVMSDEVDFAEFSQIYPDRETCFKFLSELKWTAGYACRKCANTQYLAGYLPYSRRCTKCGYDESVIAHTIFQNSRIPINKAFYLLFLVYSTKGKISSHKLSQLLLIRQSTCWAYNNKMQKILEERKKDLKNAGNAGWSMLVLEHPDPG